MREICAIQASGFVSGRCARRTVARACCRGLPARARAPIAVPLAAAGRPVRQPDRRQVLGGKWPLKGAAWAQGRWWVASRVAACGWPRQTHWRHPAAGGDHLLPGLSFVALLPTRQRAHANNLVAGDLRRARGGPHGHGERVGPGARGPPTYPDRRGGMHGAPPVGGRRPGGPLFRRCRPFRFRSMLATATSSWNASMCISVRPLAAVTCHAPCCWTWCALPCCLPMHGRCYSAGIQCQLSS